MEQLKNKNKKKKLSSFFWEKILIFSPHSVVPPSLLPSLPPPPFLAPDITLRQLQEMPKTGGHCRDVSRSKRLVLKSERTVLRSQTQTNRQNQWRENNEVRPAETVNGRVSHTTGLLGWREEGQAVLVKRRGAAGPGNLGHQLLSVHHHEALRATICGCLRMARLR